MQWYRKGNLHHFIALGTAAILLAVFCLSMTSAQSDDDNYPCDEFTSDDLSGTYLKRGFSEPHVTELLLNPGETVLPVRPGETVSLAFRYQTCTPAPVHDLTGRVHIDGAADALAYVPASAQVSSHDRSDYRLDIRPGSSNSPIAFRTEETDKTDEIVLKWAMKVSDCVAIGTRANISVASTFLLPEGSPNADGSYEREYYEYADSLTLVVARTLLHRSTSTLLTMLQSTISQ